MQKPRERIDWDSYNMLIALTCSLRSPDPNTQVGCYLIDEENRPLGSGYNSIPAGCNVNNIPWAREGLPEETKYPFVIHAEINCILHANFSTRNSILYTTLFPCNECMKLIIQSGVKEIVYLENKYKDTWQCKTALKMAEEVGLKYRQYSFQEDINIFLKEILDKIELSKIIKD